MDPLLLDDEDLLTRQEFRMGVIAIVETFTGDQPMTYMDLGQFMLELGAFYRKHRFLQNEELDES